MFHLLRQYFVGVTNISMIAKKRVASPSRALYVHSEHRKTEEEECSTIVLLAKLAGKRRRSKNERRGRRK